MNVFNIIQFRVLVNLGYDGFYFQSRHVDHVMLATYAVIGETHVRLHTFDSSILIQYRILVLHQTLQAIQAMWCVKTKSIGHYQIGLEMQVVNVIIGIIVD